MDIHQKKLNKKQSVMEIFEKIMNFIDFLRLSHTLRGIKELIFQKIRKIKNN